MTKKKRVGRPTKRPGENEVTPKRYFRMPDSEWAAIVTAAKKCGETTSAFVRRVIVAAAKRIMRK